MKTKRSGVSAIIHQTSKILNVAKTKRSWLTTAIKEYLKNLSIAKKSLITLLMLASCLTLAEQMVGGFGAPIYFTQYDQDKINSIKHVQGVNHILISYQVGIPQLQRLAQNIAHNLPGIQVILKPFNLKNTRITQYDLTSVIVVIYFIPQKPAQ